MPKYYLYNKIIFSMGIYVKISIILIDENDIAYGKLISFSSIRMINKLK